MAKIKKYETKDGERIDLTVTDAELLEAAKKATQDMSKGTEAWRRAIKLAGSGDIDFSQVICDDIEVDVAGSGDVEVKSIDVNNANISIAGSGDVEMHFVRADHVSAHVAGSGDIKLTGKAKQVEHRVAGSGDIDIANLQTGK